MAQKLLTAIFILAAFNSINVWSQEISPIGLWRNIDDHTGKSKALIRISDAGSEFQGRIETLFLESDKDQNPLCKKCEGTLKDQPILGMTILSGFKLNDSEYSGGTIVDPDNGKSYKSKMSLAEDGKKLIVRGYIGIPLFGRSQTWIREQ